MDEITVETLREENPKLVQAIIEADKARKQQELDEELQRREAEERETQELLSEREAVLREKLGLSDTDDLLSVVNERNAELARLQEAENKRKIAAYISEEVGKLKYPDWMKEQLAEALAKAEPATVDEAREMIIARRPEYDAIISKLRMRQMGHEHGIEVLGPVLESETGVPEFARAAHEINESLVRADPRGIRRNLAEPKTINERWTAEYLRVFDKQYKQQLMAEAKLFAEAETASDLNLPTSVLRAVIAEAFPELVATSIFDFAMIATSPTLLYYEAYAGETGAENVQVTDEAVTSDESAWVALAHQRIEPGSVVVEPDGGGTAYVEDTDYVIDYANGRLWTLPSPGTIGDATALDVDYQYYAYREGEGGEIQQGKVGLSTETITAAADRLATQINDEAIVFSRSQLGYDAVTKTLSALVRQIKRRIDEGIFRLALASVKIVASNSGGTWTAASDTVEDLVEKIGTAKVLVGNRYYEPSAVVCSLTNSDRLSNWDGFAAAGSRPDAQLNANGFIGRIKGLNAFESTEFPDGYIAVVNRELVMHRVYQTLRLKGPFHTVGSNNLLVAAEQYYAEEYNVTAAPVPQKGAYVKIA